MLVETDAPATEILQICDRMAPNSSEYREEKLNSVQIALCQIERQYRQLIAVFKAN